MTLAALALDNLGVSRAAAEVGSTANSYQILAKLAIGGMAEIFLARGEGVAGVERYCVLKRILRERASDVNFVRMFLDEARLAAQLQHPNIAQVYDIGKLGDSYFFTMEYVHGETVRSLMHRAQGLRRALPIGAILTIGAGTAAGLHHAHERVGFDGRPLGIVHRDVSPSNLMVSYEGSVKVVDFGVAKAADRGHETKSGTVKGKISYLSPEQCKGKRVDRRSDVYSLGICLWEMLTTERLFRRSSDFENMHAIVNEDTPPPSSRRPDVPREVDELVLRMLAKTPEERLQTADEVVEAIEQVAAKTGSVLSTSGLGKLMRELFGQRPEPWLELENQQEPGEAITVTSEPIPPELAAEPVDKVNQQLASVLDLSPRVVTESLESLGPLVAPGSGSGPAAAGSPARGSPDSPGSRAAAASPVSPASRGAAPLLGSLGLRGSSESTDVPDESPGLRSSPGRTASLDTPAPRSSSGGTASLESFELLPADVPTTLGKRIPLGLPLAAPPTTSPGTRLPAPAELPPPLPPPPPPGRAHAAVLPDGDGALPGPRAVAKATPLAISSVKPATGETKAVPAPLDSFPAGPERATPGASPGQQAGAIVPPSGQRTALSASSGHLPRMTSSGHPAAAADSHGSMRSSASHRAPVERHGWPFYAVIGGAALIGSVAVILAMGSDGAETGATSAGHAASAVVRPADSKAALPSPPSAITVVPIEPGANPSGNAASAGSGAAKPVTDEPAADPSTAQAGTAPKATRPTRVGAPPRAAPTTAAAQPPAKGAPDDELGRWYAAEQYDKVVEQCGAGPLPAEHAPMCFLAACHVRNEAKARKWIAAVPAAKREQLTTNCKQLGVDVKKSDKPVDCEADPMACQH